MSARPAPFNRRPPQIAQFTPPSRPGRSHRWTCDEISLLRHYRDGGSTWPECATALDAYSHILISADACKLAYKYYQDWTIARNDEGTQRMLIPPSTEVVEIRREEREMRRREVLERRRRKGVVRAQGAAKKEGKKEEGRDKENENEEGQHVWTEKEISHVKFYRGECGYSFERIALALDSCCQVFVSAEQVQVLWEGLLVEKEDE